ncbi:MAG TPA: PfkB family carbohydrate kinase [Chloroflexota bacterium]|nr:PfkB family carbohydrate kinase [Chloroflexota bacterium]
MLGGAAGNERGTIDYLLLGHVTVDRLDDKRVVLGGTATYASLTARNMGGRAGVHTSAAYEPGLIDTLGGVMVARIPAEYTTCFVNEYSGGKRRQSIESIAEKLTYEQILAEWRNPPVVHLGPLCQEIDTQLVNRFPRSLVGVTPQGWMRGWDEAGVVQPVDWADADKVLARADAVIISEDDVADASVIAEWAARARMLVVTLGERGCDVYKEGEAPFHSAGFQSANEVDPTGAGDVFAAAFLWHLHQSGGDWQTAADWANCVASFVVEKRGVAGVPKLADVEKRWRTGTRVGVRVGAS